MRSTDLILFISYWNPNLKNPGKGLFIHEQANCLASEIDSFCFVEVNIGYHPFKFCSINSELILYGKGKRLIVNISSVGWKIIYQLPFISEKILWRELKKYNLDEKVGVVHSNVVFPAGVVGMRLSKKIGARFFISEHWSRIKKIASNPIFKGSIVKAYNTAETTICVSEWLANNVREVANNANVTVVPNIVSSDYFYPLGDNCISNVNQVSFCCTATWRLPKRFDLIIASVCDYAKENSDRQIILNVVGDGEQLLDIERAIIPANLTVIRHGHICKKDVGEVLRASDYFMHASNVETFSIVVAEALSCGIPVIASNVGALPFLVNDKNGVLCDNTVESWRFGINLLTSRIYDKAWISRKSGGVSAQQFVVKMKSLYGGV